MIRSAFLDITSIHPSDEEWEQISRSSKRGGLGLRNPEQFSPLAYYASALFASSVEEELELSEIEAIAEALEAVNKDALRDHSLVLTMDTKFVKEDKVDMDNDPDGNLRFRESPSDARIKETLPTQKLLSQELEDANLRSALVQAGESKDTKKLARLRSTSAK